MKCRGMRVASIWKPPWTSFCNVRVGKEWREESGCHGLLCEVVEPIFSFAAAPHIHPFVNPSADSAAGRNRFGSRHRVFCSTFSRTQTASIRATPTIARRSTGSLRLVLRREGLFFQGRRADATAFPVATLSLFYN